MSGKAIARKSRQEVADAGADDAAHRVAFVVARRKPNGWFGFPNGFMEKQLGVVATTRQWSTIKKFVAFAEKG